MSELNEIMGKIYAASEVQGRIVAILVNASSDGCIVSLMLYIICFKFSLGPLLWIYMADIMTDLALSLSVGLCRTPRCFIRFFTKSLTHANLNSDYQKLIVLIIVICSQYFTLSIPRIFKPPMI